MKILYYYPKSDNMITRHVTILAEGIRNSAEVQAATTLNEFKMRLETMKPDIVHCHGCWQYATYKASAMARKQGVRVVLSPHGQLEPWVIKERSTVSGDSKSPTTIISKSVLLQRRATESAFALIAFGKMEHKYLRQIGWNPRIEIIHNAVITNSLSPKEMCSQTFAVYQKVLDSNVLEQMSSDDRNLLSLILKAGITGDARWITSDAAKAVGDLQSLSSSPDWRRIFIYAEHQNIRNYVDYGISVLKLQPNDLDTSKIASYFPEKYQRPVPLKNLIGDFKGDETDYLIRMLRQIQKAPLLLHLIELHRELHRDSVDDDSLSEALEEKRLTSFAARLMQVLSEQTLLDEGYMPLAPLDDRGTQQIRNLIANHLRI